MKKSNNCCKKYKIQNKITINYQANYQILKEKTKSFANKLNKYKTIRRNYKIKMKYI